MSGKAFKKERNKICTCGSGIKAKHCDCKKNKIIPDENYDDDYRNDDTDDEDDIVFDTEHLFYNYSTNEGMQRIFNKEIQFLERKYTKEYGYKVSYNDCNGLLQSFLEAEAVARIEICKRLNEKNIIFFRDGIGAFCATSDKDQTTVRKIFDEVFIEKTGINPNMSNEDIKGDYEEVISKANKLKKKVIRS